MPRLDASRTKPGLASWMSRITGQEASCTIFSISASACSELSPRPTSAPSGRSRAVTGPTSSTSISLAITSCPRAATMGATRASRSRLSLAISTRRCSVSRLPIPLGYPGPSLSREGDTVVRRSASLPRRFALRLQLPVGPKRSAPRAGDTSVRPLGRCALTGRFRGQVSGKARMDSQPSPHNLAARMARWSSKNRKKAFWGWLAFVVLAFAIGNAVGSNLISDVDNFNGESHDAEAALDRAGLRPQSEVVFIQSDKLAIKDPQLRAAIEDVTSRLPKVPYVKNVKSPLEGESAVSADGHAVLVDFDVAGDSTEAQDRIDP